MNYGRAIKIVRNVRDLSQFDLAKKVNVCPSYISCIEANKRKPTLEVLEQIANALKIKMHLLIFIASTEITKGPELMKLLIELGK
jgi:XRE family transcriptional regulator, regulator of sulfur utilization